MSGSSDKSGPAFHPDAGRRVDVLASMVGLTITDAQRPGVVRFLSLAETMAALVYSVPLPDDTLELAPVFRPGDPDGREA